MSNSFIARGNLAAAPELKSVTVNGEQRHVAELRLYCDRPVPDGDGGFKDKGGFWLNVSRWGRSAEHVARVLDKGYRVRVEGTLVQNRWEKDGEERSRLELNADDITLDLARVESLAMRPSRQARQEQTQNPADHSVASGDVTPTDALIEDSNLPL